MNLKNSLITALGGTPKGEFEKTTNRVHGTDFLRYGARGRSVLPPDWAEVKIADEDVYKGYPYAVIQKRANKVASLAKENLNTWVKPEALDIFQKKQVDPLHPYLKIIEDSTDFSTKQFWKTICIYLDLAGAYYLGVLRNKIPSKSLDKKNFPDLYSDVSQFILLNPYEIKRVINQNGEVAGYLETKKDGRQREWPPYMIIPMRELNPFDSDKVWSMTDAAKEETYTLKQSGNYTRETLTHNLNAPGIISTDVILDDQKFADFAERVKLHTKGEPLFGNGTGSITWAGMQQDLDKSALLDINEINRTALFAVSGTSKTALGIEQSGTTRETARVQTEQFISDTAQPRLEDIIDFLNLDYKRHYKNEYDKVGYWLEIQSAASRDYTTETQATQMRQAQSNLAFDLMQKGYTMESSYDYAEGKIELSELELEKGLDKPKSEETPPEDTPPENTPSDAPESPTGDDTAEDDTTTVPEETEENTALANLEGLEPHAQLKTNSSAEVTLDSRPQESKHNHQECDCGKVEVLINELGEDGKTLEESYKKFLTDIESVQKETYKACVSKLTVNAFTEEDIIGERKKRNLTNKLKSVIQNYWWILTPLLANSLMEARNEEFGENVKFVFTNELQNKVENNASRVAEGHMETILNDVLTASNRAYAEITERKAAELIVEAYKTNQPKYAKYFEEQPSMTEALRAIRNTDILEENRKIYERANELAMQGYKREDIIKKIREEYKHLSKRRAELIAQNETSRAYGHSQYEADTQFLNSIGQLDTAYKQWYSRRPENEKDKICPFCQQLIDMGPIPFTQNFVNLGDTLTVERDGKVYNFVCNYENIESSTLHPNCFARDTQVYTNEGWKRVDSLTGKELFWSIDPETRKPEWVKAKHLVQGYAEKLIRYQNKNFDMATTLDHNMFVEKKHKDKNRVYREFEFVEAQNLARQDRFYAGVEWEGVEPETIKVGDYNIPTELYCKFMGYYLSEGCANVYKAEGRKNGQRYQATIGQATRYDEFKKDLEKLPFRIWCGKEAFTFNDESVVKYCMQFGKSSEKYIPNEIKQLSPRLLRIFLDAFMLGDGHKRLREKTMSLERVLSTSSVTLRDDLTEIIQKAGFRPTVGLYKPKGTPYKGTNYLSNNDLWRISICNRVHTYKEATRKSIVDYYDDVFCVELEKNHTLWTMYNGRCWWSGNCMCSYRLILNGKTLNELPSNEPNPNDGSDRGLNDNSLDSQAKAVNGGLGSGNYGHLGRPGLVGGSAKDDSFMQELFFTPSFEKALESNPTLAKSLERQLVKFARNGLDIGRIRFGIMEIPDGDEKFMSSGLFPAEPLENTFIMSNVVARGDTRFDEALKQYYEDGWWAGGTLDYAIAHELGHAKTYQLMLAQDGNSFEDYGSEEEVVASSRALAKNIFLEATGGADIETLRHGKGGDISGYGYKRAKAGDYLEIIAEAYGNPNFSGLSGKIVETLDKKHKVLYNNSMKRRIVTFDTSQIIASTVFHDKKAYEEYMRGE